MLDPSFTPVTQAANIDGPNPCPNSNQMDCHGYAKVELFDYAYTCGMTTTPAYANQHIWHALEFEISKPGQNQWESMTTAVYPDDFSSCSFLVHYGDGFPTDVCTGPYSRIFACSAATVNVTSTTNSTINGNYTVTGTDFQGTVTLTGQFTAQGNCTSL
jgi:hypothetical protein